ncbi:GNAT family N-acetyltransferase [Jeongeupia chitinilytica]|uniref:N-acetyltransferase domain-containing protein n=1 Tax=Jeongeupia chitinilytica TaxID=1041641 RepID=A0ABQ3H5Z7_9NEIS|nr:GNAT family N-acetyltransferase [Jeongeupia chitinilytica]GHD68873.1 hypothetical protein GCM10007350_34740 [Jeongeupia chitinilytica]
MHASVRPLRADDLSSLAAAYIATFNAAPWHDEWQTDTALAYLGGLLANPACRAWVIEHEGGLAGAAIGHLRLWWQGTELFIDEFFIGTARQRSGLGQRLLAGIEAELHAEGVVAVTLLTGRATPAEAFYLAQGYRGNSDLQFMARSLA